MKTGKVGLLLNGSPKGKKGTSYSLGHYIIKHLAEHEYTFETVNAIAAVKSDNNLASLLDLAGQADFIICSTPLYIDCLPAPLVKTMEVIARHRKSLPAPSKTQFLAIVNSGFPEAHQNDTALAILRQFAREANLEWWGGLALGGGAFVSGRPLENIGRMGKSIIQSLDIVVDDIQAGRPLSDQAVQLMAQPPVPVWLYTVAGNKGWTAQAKKNQVDKIIDAQPFKKL